MEYLDMISKLGIGNAHPGGFAATLQQLKQYPLPANANVLEVGCGTGRTSCYIASQGHSVTGLDIRLDMIAKAKVRAEKEQANVEFLQGDACALPFPADSFDIVMVESVSIFTDTAKALSEYFRVLRPGGTLYDKEMVSRAPMPPEVHEEITRYFQIPQLMDTNDWLTLLNTSAFQHFHIDGPHAFPHPFGDQTEFPDLHQQMDNGIFLNPAIWETSNKYNSIMEQHGDSIGYITVVGRK
ncbi:class I SAM-dependent methyltransferase [Paenibacillus turpanensis]|uniref:class I SAM-dependent methyltransferase n=1 Tax=Paenibacillus turpanensis TaxID=2689078 RepID=UPI00140B2A34|nr:class I SAM-dependent methyltransferase [Paenibacillus turpanensis]